MKLISRRISRTKNTPSGHPGRGGAGGWASISGEKRQENRRFQKNQKRGLTWAWGKRNVRPVRLRQEPQGERIKRTMVLEKIRLTGRPPSGSLEKNHNAGRLPIRNATGEFREKGGSKVLRQNDLLTTEKCSCNCRFEPEAAR